MDTQLKQQNFPVTINFNYLDSKCIYEENILQKI